MTQTPLTITDAGEALRRGDTTSRELVERAFDAADASDPIIGVYIRQFRESAIEAAEQADAELAAGTDRGPLHGIPIGVKDIIATREGPTTGQSVVYDPEWYIGCDAPVVGRLRAGGAVITGKTTTMEYACGLPDAEKPYPVPRNAWDPARWPGGSSSGSGSGLASGMFLGALGTDTGGSVRLPASYSGISGLKQTYGIVPKNGCYPLGVTLDHIGPMARSARDCAAMLQLMVGFDPGDPTVIEYDAPDYVSFCTGSLQGLRIGVERTNHFKYPGADPALEPLFEAAVDVLRDAGATVSEVTIPYYDELKCATMMTWPAEAFAYHHQWLQTRWTDYGKPTRAVIGGAAFITSTDYVQAQKVRLLGQRLVGELFEDVDLILSPTTATAALEIDHLAWDQLIDSLFTPVWNALGNPALSVPMGFNGEGLPLGLQIVGRPLEDGLVLQAGDAYQQRTGWHLMQPSTLAEVEVQV